MRILITGNSTFGLAAELNKIFPTAFLASRSSGFDLVTPTGQDKLLQLVDQYDTIVNCSALFQFNQTILLEKIYKKCLETGHRPHIISIGSTTDRVKNGKVWLYNAEKKALRDFSNSLGLAGVWGAAPKVTYLSFGSLSNVQHKHPERRCMAIETAAKYVEWVINQPKNIAINELSIDPMQDSWWHGD